MCNNGLEQGQRPALHLASELDRPAVAYHLEPSERTDLDRPWPRLTFDGRRADGEMSEAYELLHVLHFNAGLESACTKTRHDWRLPHQRVDETPRSAEGHPGAK